MPLSERKAASRSVQQLLILLHQCVFRLGEDLYQIVPAQTVEGHHHRHTAYQLRDDAEFQQIVGLNLL